VGGDSVVEVGGGDFDFKDGGAEAEAGHGECSGLASGFVGRKER
jgi:hypothetical protein